MRALVSCLAGCVIALATHPEALRGQAAVLPAPGYEAVVAALESLITHEMEDKRLPGLSIALVDDQRIVWARGFGFASLSDSTPTTAETIHRVGSVSKLFTDIGIMQLVERGTVDLDVPIARYLPSFQPRNAYGQPITLRQLMSHRSGLQREPPAGNYFETTQPTLAATVASLNGRDLIYQPGSRAKYSNAGIGVVGYVLESLQAEPFAPYLQRTVLAPLGLQSSTFEPTPEIQAALATGYMWTWDGRRFEAPTFQLGMAPAGSMYSSVLDLGRFLSALFGGGRAPGGQVLRRETLEQMWTPQFAQPNQRTGFGIGFAISELDGKRRIGHGGAIYGFATDLAALPDEKLGVAIVITLDVTNAVAERITEAALRLMLATRQRSPLPLIRVPSRVAPARARGLEGRYAKGERRIDLIERYGDLIAQTPATYTLRAFGDTLIIDDRLAYGARLLPIGTDRLVVGRDTLVRTTVERPVVHPERWSGLIGEYGWDHNTLYIGERDGKLHALIEWFFLYPLEELEPDVYRFPASGLYEAEKLIFTRGPDGKATRVEAAGVVFDRRAVGTEAGVTFRIDPVRPVEELRRDALAASPPREAQEFRQADLVELRSVDPTIRYDIRYATTNNFMGAVFYSEAKALLQRLVAEALVRAHRKLKEKGYGLLIHDAYRPWYVTKMFWDATPARFKHFVADPAQGSRHNRGAAVDLTLYDLATGQPVTMVGGYDEFSDRSYPDYPGGTSLQRWHRELLRDALEAEGFRVYEWEWWHFDFDGWREFPILNTREDS